MDLHPSFSEVVEGLPKGNGPKMAQDGPKKAPRWRKRPQEGPKMAQNGPKTAPKMAQDGPKKAPRWRKTARRKCHE